jgi:hypothetical protein
MEIGVGEILAGILLVEDGVSYEYFPLISESFRETYLDSVMIQ